MKWLTEKQIIDGLLPKMCGKEGLSINDYDKLNEAERTVMREYDRGGIKKLCSTLNNNCVGCHQAKSGVDCTGEQVNC